MSAPGPSGIFNLRFLANYGLSEPYSLLLQPEMLTVTFCLKNTPRIQESIFWGGIPFLGIPVLQEATNDGMDREAAGTVYLVWRTALYLSVVSAGCDTRVATRVAVFNWSPVRR
jgi:hypothetical protein